MRVTYRREGGLAYLPGLSRPLDLDTATMPSEQAARLEELVEAADFFECAEPSPPPAEAADIYRYTLEVRRGRRRRTLRLSDPIVDAGLQELVAYLEQLRAGATGRPSGR
jgi:hypothetical protein